jgi:hypothetical protein
MFSSGPQKVQVQKPQVREPQIVMELIKESKKKLFMCFLRIGSTYSWILSLKLPMVLLTQKHKMD